MNLTLVSPHTKGSHVKALQTLLHKKGFLQGKVDGEFGPDTARAVYRAKYWLGYRKPDQVAGDYLYSLLKGIQKPSLSMQILIKRRKKIANQTTVGEKMWKEAGKYIGQKESPFGSNRSMFSVWYGIIAAWCAMFVSYVGVKIGSKVFRRGHRYAYVPNILMDARQGRNNLAITYNPTLGNLALFDWDNDGIPDHVGLFGNWLEGGRTTFSGREGNTGPVNFSNGGMVMNTQRRKSDVVAFVHVGS